MSFHKASKKDEKEFEEYTITAKKQEEEPAAEKANIKGLQKALEKEGITYGPFAGRDEYYRKRVLKDKYAEFKTKYGWQYDQPIEG